MDWKSTIIGSLLSLMVATISGVGVYYFTIKSDNLEKLTYFVSEPISYDSDSLDINIQDITIFNKGGLVVKNIQLSVAFDKGVIIKERKITTVSKITENYKILKDSSGFFRMVIQSILPEDNFRISMLILSKDKIKSPIVSVNSEQKMANIEDFSHKEKDFVLIPLIASFTALIALIVYIVPMYFKRWLNPFLNRLKGIPTRNNTAFLLIHQMLYDIAENVLEKKVLEKGGDAIEISNYALFFALKGNYETAQKIINASFYYIKYIESSDNHIIAICNFNQALVYFLAKKYQEGRDSLFISLEKSRENIISYCEYSEVVKKLRNDGEINKIFEKLLA
jgi:hypothetical protein